MDPTLNEVIKLALKLEENVAYAIPTSSYRLYKFPPRPAHAVANNLSMRQTKARCGATIVGSWGISHETVRSHHYLV